jgi:hypothetical protein
VIREAAMRAGHGRDQLFRWRGREVSRLEGFSDAVFGFALTLLVVSLEVPRTFHELRLLVWELPAFAVCFLILFGTWNGHYTCCRRYGLVDGPTRALTGLLLFLVLFYVYPLKFLWSFMFGALLVNSGWLPPDIEQELTARIEPMLTEHDAAHVMVLYSGGYLAVMATFALMHLQAARRRTELALDDVEAYVTRWSTRFYAAQAAVAAVSIAIAASGHAALAGWSYFLMFPLGFGYSRRMRRQVERLRGTAA